MDESTVRPIATHILEMLAMLEKASACTDDSRVSKSHLVKKEKEKEKERIFHLSLRIFPDTCIPFNTFFHDGIVTFRQISAFLPEIKPPPNS